MISAKQWNPSDFVGGRDCLDFANTVDWTGSPTPNDVLQEYRDLLGWCAAAGLIRSGQAKTLRRLARAEPEAATQVLRRARELRRALRGLFVSWADGESPRKADLDGLNDLLARAPVRLSVRWRKGDYDWARPEHRSLEMLLWPVTWSAADLLTHGDPVRLKRCADDGCSWFFYDASRNRSRRWCSMSTCGNRAKAQRHYQRTKVARTRV